MLMSYYLLTVRGHTEVHTNVYHCNSQFPADQVTVLPAVTALSHRLAFKKVLKHTMQRGRESKRMARPDETPVTA